MYCLDKKLILFGEKLLLKRIEKWFCDIREDFVMFGYCLMVCLVLNGNFFELGCSIGLVEVEFIGFVGFLVEFNNEFGFLIVLYVVVWNYKYFYNEEIMFLYFIY